MARKPSDGTGSGSAAYQRIAAREEAARQRLEQDQAAARDAMNVRIEQALDHVASELGEIKSGMRKLGHGHEELVNRVGDLERQVVDTRDEVQKRAVHPAPSQVASAKKAIRETAKSPAGIVAAVCIFITTISAAGGGIPKLIQGAERFWAFLAGREVAAISRPLVEPAKVPEK